MLSFQWTDDFHCGLKIITIKNVSIDCCFCQDYESSAMCSVKNDAVPAEVDEKLSYMRPVVVLKTLNLAQ